MGSGLIVPFVPLCRRYGHGWRPAGFAPLPWGRVPFCLQQQKGTKKCRPGHPADSCASRPVRGLADASIRAANAGHPWPAPAGLIRPDLRCSGGTKGKLARLAGYAGIARAMLGKAQRAGKPSTLHARRCQLRLEGAIGQGWPIEVRATGSGSHRPWKAGLTAEVSACWGALDVQGCTNAAIAGCKGAALCVPFFGRAKDCREQSFVKPRRGESHGWDEQKM